MSPLHDAHTRLGPVLRTAEAELPFGARLPTRLVQAIRAQGLWKLWVPQQYGGAELDLPASLAVFEAAAAVDGSLGFALGIGAGGGLFAAYLPADTASTIFSPAEALIAGSGMPSGEAAPAAQGFTVNGEWQYASLIHEATWVTANTRRADSGEIMAVAVPAGAVEIGDDWHVHALRATDSQSIRMRNITVPATHTFRLDRPPRLDAPLYRFPFDALAAACFAAVAVGIARGAVQTFGERLETRRSTQAAGTAVREQRLARADGLQQAARALLDDAAATAWRQVAETGALDEALDARVHLAAVTATAHAVEAVEALAQVAGMSLLYEHDRLGRCWRDVHGVAQHAYISASREQELGGRAAAPPE